MPAFGKESLKNRGQLHPKLQALLDETIRIMDFTIVCGWRGQRDQDAAYKSGASTKKWPNSKHNKIPSEAADLCPYRKGLRWEDKEAFYLLSGILKTLAFKMGIKIRVGSDWDMDNDLHDQEFNDLPHVEVILD
jgi:peptidoglycan L-alanyl-D-glutamate endopeptidase CwlK